jgi:hypothetical protein
MSISEVKILDLENVASVQCSPGAVDRNIYNFGLAKGLLVALAIIKDENVTDLEIPDRWIANYLAESRLLKRVEDGEFDLISAVIKILREEKYFRLAEGLEKVCGKYVVTK